MAVFLCEKHGRQYGVLTCLHIGNRYLDKAPLGDVVPVRGIWMTSEPTLLFWCCRECYVKYELEKKDGSIGYGEIPMELFPICGECFGEWRGIVKNVPYDGLKRPTLTEDEWFSGANITEMIEYVGFPFGNRKRELVLIGQLRLVWDVLDERCRAAVNAKEKWVEGQLSYDEMNEHWGAFDDAISAMIGFAYRNPNVDSPRSAVLRDSQKAYLYEIFGSPFRPITIDPRWRTATVIGLARGMYDERDFSRMSVLADALKDAGCDSEEIIAHCRQPGGHVRGCWVVDLILSKDR